MTTSALNEAALRRTLSGDRSRGSVADNPGLNDEKRVSRLTSCSLQSGTDRLVAHTTHWKDAPLPSEVYTATVPNVSERWLPAELRWVWRTTGQVTHVTNAPISGRLWFSGREGWKKFQPTVTSSVSRAWDDIVRYFADLGGKKISGNCSFARCRIRATSFAIRWTISLKRESLRSFSKNGSISSAR
jgi:hypothetical protein